MKHSCQPWDKSESTNIFITDTKSGLGMITVKNEPTTPPANYPPSLELIFENLLKRTTPPPPN